MISDLSSKRRAATVIFSSRLDSLLIHSLIMMSTLQQWIRSMQVERHSRTIAGESFLCGFELLSSFNCSCSNKKFRIFDAVSRCFSQELDSCRTQTVFSSLFNLVSSQSLLSSWTKGIFRQATMHIASLQISIWERLCATIKKVMHTFFGYWHFFLIQCRIDRPKPYCVSQNIFHSAMNDPCMNKMEMTSESVLFENDAVSCE